MTANESKEAIKNFDLATKFADGIQWRLSRSRLITVGRPTKRQTDSEVEPTRASNAKSDETKARTLAELQAAKSRAGSFTWNKSERELSRWRSELRTSLEAVDPEYARSLDSLSFTPQVIGPFVNEEDWKLAFQNGLNSAVRLVEQAILNLTSFSPLSHTVGRPAPGSLSRKKIFVVHGHDHGARDAVALFVERLGFEAVVLDQQASKGATVIQKLEELDLTDVVYTIILLTPDDIGGKTERDLKPRARQNVIFEAGYFVARQKRRNVCAMMKEHLELPSDMAGIVYITFDDGGGWKYRLVIELKELDLEVDANLAM